MIATMDALNEKMRKGTGLPEKTNPGASAVRTAATTLGI